MKQNRVALGILLFLLLLQGERAFALFEWRNAGAEALGFSEGYTAIARGIESIPFNPAGLVDARISLQASYIPIYGGLDVGLRSADLSLAYAFPFFTVGVRIQDVGADLGEESGGRYGEETFTVSFARYLNRSIRCGINLNGYHLQFPSPFGSATTFGFDFGVLADLYKRWRFGFMVENLNQASLETTAGTEPLPVALSVGIAFLPSEYLITAFDIRKEPDFPARIAFAQEVGFWADRFKIRGGVQSEGERFRWSAGLGFSVSMITLNYAAVFDPNLPLTHSIGIRYRR